MTESCGSIWVVTKLASSPNEVTNFFVKCNQFTFGYASECAAQVPVAPPNFPISVCPFMWLYCLVSLCTNTEISFPNVVGVAD